MKNEPIITDEMRFEKCKLDLESQYVMGITDNAELKKLIPALEFVANQKKQKIKDTYINELELFVDTLFYK